MRQHYIVVAGMVEEDEVTSGVSSDGRIDLVTSLQERRVKIDPDKWES